MFFSWFSNFMHNMDNTYLEKKNLWPETILKAHIQMQVLVFHMCFHASKHLQFCNGRKFFSSCNGFFALPLLGICPHEIAPLPFYCFSPFFHVSFILHLFSILCLKLFINNNLYMSSSLHSLSVRTRHFRVLSL